MESKKQLEQRDTHRESRSERISRLQKKVEALFPEEFQRDLRENIKRSFFVPQIGEYHNEGLFMDSHLDLILKNIDDVRKNIFPDDLSPSVQRMLNQAASADMQAVEKYVFLHDIAKADCLTIKYANSEQSITWDEWNALLETEPEGRDALGGNENALRDFAVKKGITSISYWQKNENATRNHGDIGANYLASIGMQDDDPMLKAIRTHEVAYQFSRINVKTYEKYFGNMDQTARNFALLASYVDTMASLRKNGQPNLENFLALAGSCEKYEACKQLADELEKLSGLDKNKVKSELDKIKGSDEPLTIEQVPEILARMKEKCRPTAYNIQRLTSEVQRLITSKTLSEEEGQELIRIATSNPQNLGKTFGKKMKDLKEALEASEE